MLFRAIRGIALKSMITYTNHNGPGIVFSKRECAIIFFSLSFLVSPLAILISVPNPVFDVRSNVSFECSSLGGPGNTYQWQFNGSNIQGQVSKMLVLNNVQVADGGIYTCLVQNAAGNDSASTFLNITVRFLSQPESVFVVSGATVSLTCDTEAFPIPTYQWGRADDKTIRDSIITNRRMLLFEPVQFGDEGDYYCNASSSDVTLRSEDATVTSELP